MRSRLLAVCTAFSAIACGCPYMLDPSTSAKAAENAGATKSELLTMPAAEPTPSGSPTDAAPGSEKPIDAALAREPSPERKSVGETRTNDGLATKDGAPQPRFLVTDHWRLVAALNGTVPGRRCLVIFDAEQLVQDTLGMSNGPVHFDNCAFAEGLDRIAQLTTDGDRCASGECWDQALGAFGAALHTIQDFYAHSNWLELGVNGGASIDDYSKLRLWTNEGRDEVTRRSATHELISGYSSSTDPKRCASTTPTHADLGKDDTDKRHGGERIKSDKWCNLTYHDAAMRLARKASTQYILDVFGRSPRLAQYCGVNTSDLGKLGQAQLASLCQ